MRLADTGQRYRYSIRPGRTLISPKVFKISSLTLRNSGRGDAGVSCRPGPGGGANLSAWSPGPVFNRSFSDGEAQMDTITRQVVQGGAGEEVEPDGRLEVADQIENEAVEPEAPELSIEELEKLFAGLG
jgi:hypothetical protein